MMIKRNRRKSGFSLVELSIVLLIVGIVVVGVSSGSALLRSGRLSQARSYTASSPAGSSVRDLLFWAETTSRESFSVTTPTDQDAINALNDINLFNSDNYDFTNNPNAPIYLNGRDSKGINGLPVLSFNGTDHSMVTMGTYNPSSPYTVFVVAKYDVSTGTQHAFSIRNNASRMQVGFTISNNFGFSLGDQESFATQASDTEPHIFSLRSEGGTNNVNGEAYIDGSSIGTTATATLSANSLAFDLGALNGSFEYADVKIGEIIFFSRSLDAEEVDLIEQYLSLKWGIALN
jgi:prepilin-type N-terminal cleavage/methylation domain-containing protein